MSTEKRLILALVLSFLLIIFYPYVLKIFFPSLAPQPVTKNISQEQVQTTQQTAKETLRASSSGFNAPALRAPIFKTNLEKAEIEGYHLTLSPRGGLIQNFYLDEFALKNKDEGTLIKSEDGPGAFQVWLEGFESASSTSEFSREKSRTNEIIFKNTLDEKIEMKKEFIFNPNSHSFDVVLSFKNLTDQSITTRYEMSSQLFHNEKGYAASYVEFNVYAAEKIESKKAAKLKKKSFELEGDLDWFSLNRKYLSLIIKPSSNVVISEIKAKEVSPEEMQSIFMTERFNIPAGSTVEHSYLVYAGPNSYPELRSYGFGFQKLISKGFFGPLRIGMIFIMDWCYNWIPNYGVAIILLTMLIKLLFTPLTHISFVSMRRMAELQPKIKALQAQHKEDPKKLQKEMMGLYKKHKVNPLSGCLPMLLQMPIFIALYQGLSQAVQLREAPFIWWIKDLSEPDKLFTLPFTLPLLGDGVNILPLIMLGSMIWQQKLNPASGMSPEQEKMMMFMPLIFGVIFYNLPSGLVLYWTVSNFLTILHQGVIKKIHIPIPHHD